MQVFNQNKYKSKARKRVKCSKDGWNVYKAAVDVAKERFSVESPSTRTARMGHGIPITVNSPQAVFFCSEYPTCAVSSLKKIC